METVIQLLKKNQTLYEWIKSLVQKFIRVYLCLFTWRGFFRNYIWFNVKACLRKLHIPFFYWPFCGWENLKNKHDGERCFIISTGSSLRESDVDRLRNEYTFGLNKLFVMFKNKDWRPTYYCNLDPDNSIVLKDKFGFDADDASSELTFINERAMKVVRGKKMLPLCTCWLDHLYKWKSKRFKYSDDLVYGLYDAYTSTHAAINIAGYLGFREIFLIGTDNDYTGSKQHFDETGESGDGESWNSYTMNLMECSNNGYRFLEDETKKRGIKVFNATRGGKVEAFERVNFDNIEFSVKNSDIK